jgi:glycosyltransferase involved in cell wall biosynthesis
MVGRISIALATYNGARYLPALLDSIVAQNHGSYELIACDDASEDETVAILESFATRSPFSVRILRNSTRLGVTGNFSRAIAACSGEYIALADQDDIWRPGKLGSLSRALVAQGGLAAFSDASVVDVNLEPLGYSMWQRVRFTPREQERVDRGDGFAVLLKHRVVTGATLVFKADLRESVLPIPDGWPHDAWLALVAAASDGLVAVNEPLIAYRQHADNLVGGIRKPFWSEVRNALSLDRTAWYRDEISLWRSLYERLVELPTRATVRAALMEKIAHLETRASLPAARWQRLPGVFGELITGRYDRHARNWGSAAIDLLVK